MASRQLSRSDQHFRQSQARVLLKIRPPAEAGGEHQQRALAERFLLLSPGGWCRSRWGAGMRDTGRVRELLLIGMGPGHPDQVTVQAVQALNRADVFFRIDKGDDKSGLNAARDEILRRHVTRPAYCVVDIPEPPRDRSATLTADGYQGAVSDWHAARAELIAGAIAAELGPDGVGAFLVWGDPSVYDSMLRIVDQVLALGTVDFTCTVIPGGTRVP